MTFTEQHYRRNIIAIGVIRTLLKRAYLPLISVYAVTIAGVSLVQIGIVGAITSFASFALEIPSGYFADRMGHRRAMIVGTALAAVAPLAYIVWPDFWGVLWGSVAYFAGMAFISGTEQTIVHETLLATGRDDHYALVAARIQRWSLVGNMVIIFLVPFAWAVDPRWPFVIGFVLQMLTIAAAWVIVVPPVLRRVADTEPWSANLRDLWRVVITRGDLMFFVFIGFTAAISNKFFTYREIYYQEIGLDVASFGIYAALGSLVGIAATYAVPYAKGIAQHRYLIGDYLSYGIAGVIMGLTTNPIVAVTIGIIMVGYYRVRKILITEQLLVACPTRTLKATYISAASFVEAIWGMVVPLALGATMGAIGIAYGYIVSGGMIVAIATVLYLVAIRTPLLRSGERVSGDSPQPTTKN